jgi:SPP1 gp7 family putative phage head morphogenesis protein
MAFLSVSKLAAERRAAATRRRLPRVIEEHYVEDLEEAGEDPQKIRRAYRRMYLSAIGFFHVSPAIDIRVLEDEQVRLVLAGRSSDAMIGRDQALKFAALLNRTLLERVSPTYIWVTSHDERVRKMHRALDGRTFSWNDPPITNPQGEANHPGQDYNCRCVPVLPTLLP